MWVDSGVGWGGVKSTPERMGGRETELKNEERVDEWWGGLKTRSEVRVLIF